MEILHEFVHAVALGSAAGNGRNFGPKPPSSASCTTILIFIINLHSPTIARTGGKFKSWQSPPPIQIPGSR
jgi:hypothetical protein